MAISPGEKLIQPEVATSGKRKLGGTSNIHRFPQDIGLHYTVFNFLAYDSNSKDINVNPGLDGNSIVLPLPQNLIDNTSLQYADQALGTFFGGVLTPTNVNGIINTASKEGGTAEIAGSIFKSVTGTLKDRKITTAAAAIQKVAETAGGAADRAVQQAVGSRYNPFLSVFFDQVNLKTHNFAWKLSPKNEEESEILRKIINTFKTKSLPERLGANALRLKNPHQVDIALYGSGKFLFPLKRSIIESINVNYSPEGGAAFFAETGAPVVVDLEIVIKELSIHTSEDYKDESLELAAAGVG